MKTMGIIFANIYDSSLGELTNKRTMASLPYGGRYRQIDFALSNMSNSGIRHIGIITKYNYQSLMNHIGSGQEWDLDIGDSGMEYLTPFAMGHNGNYRGKLEAINSAISFLALTDEDYVVLADSGVLCAIDFREVIKNHIDSGADVTVVVKEGVCNGTKQLDMALRADKDGRVSDIAVDYCAGEGYLASMGIFVIGRERLMRETIEAVAHNRYHFERDLVMFGFAEKGMKVNACRFGGVALFNESPREFYHNNLALIDPEVRHGLFGTGHTIYTRVRDEVPSYYGEQSDIRDCIVADGCMIDGCVEHSVLFRGVQIHEGAKVKNSVIMQGTRVGKDAELECVILDKDVIVRPGARLCGTADHPLILKRGETV